MAQATRAASHTKLSAPDKPAPKASDPEESRPDSSIPDDCVLVSWIALYADPYEMAKEKSARDAGDKTPGPTLTLLFDEASPYRDKVKDVILFYRTPTDREPSSTRSEHTKAQEMVAVIKAHNPQIRALLREWSHSDPTDHRALYEFLENEMPVIRRKYRSQRLIIHVSPGTPSMQTVWVLLVETGFIPQPVQLVKSYRRDERRGRPPVVGVEIGIPSLLKVLQEAKPARMVAVEERVWWDQQQFRSPKLKAVYEEALRFSKLKVPILILGERGTGKTRLASWIRMMSPWRDRTKDKNWPSVPCGQYTPELMRAELFGHAKGAFTGAAQERVGMLQHANGDTLFLDEIGDIKRDLQRLLIRAVEDHSYVRLGDIEPSHSDFRLITATNLPWHLLKEQLDPDFLDRISYLILRLPPLREVGPDLPWLWQEVYAQAAKESRLLGRSAQLKPEDHDVVVRALQSHPLPGNMRDLFRVAYHLLSALASDGPEKLLRAEAVGYAIQQGLNAEDGGSVEDVSRAVCGAYACQAPLEGVVRGKPYLETVAVERGLRRYMAREIRRLARERDVEPGEIADVSLRTLQNWAKGEG